MATENKEKKLESDESKSNEPILEIHPNDKTGMAAHEVGARVDKHARADQSITDRSRGSRTAAPEDDEAVFESSKEAEKGFMDKTRIEERPKDESSGD